MGCVLVNHDDLDKLNSGMLVGNPGKEGSCYFLKNSKEIVKIYHYLDSKRKVYFDDLNSSNISFPKDILMYHDYIAGYTMNYLNGQKIITGFPKRLELEKLKQMYIDIKKVISNFDYIYMDDMCLANILLDLRYMKFNLIDTSRWYPQEKSKENNIQSFDKGLTYTLCRMNLGWLNEYQDKSRELFDIYRYYKLGYPVPFLDILEMVEEEIKRKSTHNVKTIGDLVLKK